MPIIQAIIGDINDSIHVLTMLESIGKKSALTIYDPRQVVLLPLIYGKLIHKSESNRTFLWSIVLLR
jgi:hypothetical protein